MAGAVGAAVAGGSDASTGVSCVLVTFVSLMVFNRTMGLINLFRFPNLIMNGWYDIVGEISTSGFFSF